MKAHPNLLSTAEEISELANKLRAQKMIAFDTEFIRESTFFPVVELIQIATAEESWLVDAQAFKKRGTKACEELRPLLEIFEDKQILKVVHASQGDQECLYTSFGVVATPSLDTAIAGGLCGYGEAPGLASLLRAILGVNIKKGHARTNWSARPLPAQLMEYAHADVEFLVELARKLLEKLDILKRREWAMELSAKWESKALYESDPEGLALRLARSGRLDAKGNAVLLELMRWREARVRHLDVPRRWVADDMVLMDLAQVRPKTMEHLSAFRGLNKGELKNSGEAILAAIRRGVEGKGLSVQREAKTEPPSAEELQALDLVKCYVGILSDRHEIAAKYLAASPQLLAILRSKAQTGMDLAKEGLLSESAARLIGDEILALLRGKRALTIEQSKVRIAEL